MPSVALVGRLSVRNCQQLCADAVQPVSEAWVSWPQQFLCVLMLVGYFRARGGVESAIYSSRARGPALSRACLRASVLLVPEQPGPAQVRGGGGRAIWGCALA